MSVALFGYKPVKYSRHVMPDLRIILMLSLIPGVYITSVKYKEFIFPDMKVLAQFILFSAASEILLTSLSKAGYQTVMLTGVHSIVELGFICFYFSAQPKFRKYRALYLILALGVSIFISYYVLSHPATYPAEAIAAQSILVILLTVFHTIQFFLRPESKFYELLVLIGFYIFYILNFPGFLYAYKIPQDMLSIFWFVQDVSGAITNLFLFMACYIFIRHYGLQSHSNS